LFAVTACDSSNPIADSMVIDGHSAHFTGPLDHAIRYAHQQVRLEAPPGNADMPMGWKSAYRACFTGPTRCAATGDAIVAIAVATGLPAYPRGSDLHDLIGDAFNHDLVYVITWDPAPCITGQVSARVCRVVDFVDGRTRAAAFAIEIADSQPIVTS
jgi:hypothetical protein